MIPFAYFKPEQRDRYLPYLQKAGERGCEYSFANLCMWGRQAGAVVGDTVVFFSQFNRKSVYLYPTGVGDMKAALDALMTDAGHRGIPFRLTCLRKEDCEALEQMYPGCFRFHNARSDYDYIYHIEDLATLKGKKYQSKRNFVNRFHKLHPDCRIVPICEENREAVEQMLTAWYAAREVDDPEGDFHMEKVAISRGLKYMEQLGMEGIALVESGKVLAMTLGSLLTADTFDIHFEKALDNADGAYNAVNQAFAAYLQGKYPNLRYLNREDDMGLEGLRQAKLSYHPALMAEKYWACQKEYGYDY